MYSSRPLSLQTEMRDQHVQHKNEVSRLRNQLQDVRHRLVAMQTRLRQTPPSSPSGSRRALSGGGIAGGSAPPSPGATLAHSPAHFSRSGSAPRTPTRSAAGAGAFAASPAELTAALLRQHLADEAEQSSSSPLTPRAAPRADAIILTQSARARKAAKELDTADVYAVLEEEEALRFTYAALSELDSEASDDDGAAAAAVAAAASPAPAANADSNLDLQQQLKRLRMELERSRQQQIARTRSRHSLKFGSRMNRFFSRVFA